MKKSLLAIAALSALASAAFGAIQRTAADIGHKAHDKLFGYMAGRGLVLGANALTALQPVLYSAAQEVSAEPFGAINAINASFDDKGVAKGDTVKVPVAPTRTPTDFTPSNVPSTGGDATADGIGVQITASKKVDWHLTGEQIRSLENADSDKEWVRQLIAQGMRALRNLAEQDCCTAIKRSASRAFGTAGTTPFASDLTALTNARKILQDNGAPLADLQLVCDTSAGLNLRNLGIFQQAYQAGSDAERRTGQFLRQFGFQITESAGIQTHVKGTGAGYLLNNGAGYAVGDKALTVDTGTGTVLAGDIATLAGDTNKYVVNGALSANVLTLGRPGLRAAHADNDALTIGNNYVPNMAFERNAVVGVMRPPVMPANPTIKQMLVSDQKGMTYLFLEIAQYGQITWELHLAWGFAGVQSEHIALVLG